MRKSWIFNLLLTLVTIVLVAGAFTAFERRRSAFEQLDFQYRWRNGVVVVQAVEGGTAAERAGLLPGDQIWVIGGVPTTEIDGLRKTLRELGPTELIVARGDRTVTLSYKAPRLQIDYRYLFLTFIGFLYLAIGLFTLYRGTRRESLLFYFLTLLAFVVYVYTPAGRVDTTYKALTLIEEFARIFLPPLTLHFFLRFPRPLVSSRGLLASLYAPPAVLALWVINLLLLGNLVPVAPPEAAFRVIDRWEMLNFALYFTIAFVALTYTYRTAPVIGEKKQIKWIYLGMGAGFIPFLILYLIPFVWSGAESELTTVAILPLALIPLAFAVSILKYKLWDVEVIIKEVLAYAVTFVFGMIAFSTVNLLLSRMIEDGMALERNFLAFASGLLIAGVLVPVKGRIETIIEMVLYRDTYRHRKAMEEFAHELARFRDLHDLLQLVREKLAAALHLTRINLYLREGDRFFLYSAEAGVPDIVRESAFADLLRDRPVELDEPRLPDASDTAITLLRNGYRYVFPLIYRSELKGILLCGTKRGEERLSSDDINLVGSLAAPVGLAIENSRLYGRLRRQLDEIRSLKEYNENIIESSSSAIVVVAWDGTILTANRAFWRLIGTDPGNLGTIHELFPPYATLPPPGTGPVEMQFENLQGDIKEISVAASPFNPSEASGTTVLVIVDVSERSRLERELQEKERLASLGLLAAGIAHEVNTPLTGISSYAQLLLADVAPDDPKYGILKKMEQQTFRASHLVNNLLDLAANRKQAAEIVDVGDAVRATLVLVDDLMKSKQIEVAFSGDDSCFVFASFSELQQVFTNLLLNARDAVAHGGRIDIRLAADGRDCRIEIVDDGPGIPATMLGEIFKPLVTTRGGQGGTGLGLAICQRIVEGIGGEISARNNSGSGATFSVVLPLTTATQLAERATIECGS